MSHSSNVSEPSDLEKDVGFEKEIGHTHLTEAEEDAIESLDPPFTEKDDAGVAGDGESLTRVQSEKPSVNNIKAVPNGGLNAWLQVISSFFVFFNTWGIINAVRQSHAAFSRRMQLIMTVVWNLPNILRAWLSPRLITQRHQLGRLNLSLSADARWDVRGPRI
jgi:hypothetical protein